MKTILFPLYLIVYFVRLLAKIFHKKSLYTLYRVYSEESCKYVKVLRCKTKLGQRIALLPLIDKDISLFGSPIQGKKISKASGFFSRKDLYLVNPGLFNVTDEVKECQSFSLKEKLKIISVFVLTTPLMIFERSTTRSCILNVDFNNINVSLFKTIFKKILKNRDLKTINFLNANNLNLSLDDPTLKQHYENSDLVLCDGLGVNLACLFQGIDLKNNLNGTDVFPIICEMCEKKEASIYFYGGTANVIKNLKKKLALTYPNLRTHGNLPGKVGVNDEQAIEEINRIKPDVVIVGLGTPLQENWIANNRHRIPSKTIIGVGGLLDFYSGKKKRAPKFLRSLGLEWCYRLYLEPKRMWRRYIIGNFTFMYNVYSSMKGSL